MPSTRQKTNAQYDILFCPTLLYIHSIPTDDRYVCMTRRHQDNTEWPGPWWLELPESVTRHQSRLFRVEECLKLSQASRAEARRRRVEEGVDDIMRKQSAVQVMRRCLEARPAPQRTAACASCQDEGPEDRLA